jgi:Rad3-related DNA helicase
MKTDFHANLVIDSAGEIMGSGMTETHAIEDAAKNLQMETWDIESLIEKAKNGYQGEEETLLLRTRQEWEDTAGMTIEEYLGK